MNKFKTQKSGLLKSAAILSAFSLICKFSGMVFRLFLTGRIGAEGMGLYQLILSVYSLFTTFATAGFSVSVSRLSAEAFENINIDEGRKNATKVLKTSLLLSLFIGFISSFSMLSLSGVFAKQFLNDQRTLIPLRILAFSMPFMALSSCLKGYFTAARKISIPAAAQLFEQIMKISITYTFMMTFMISTTDVGTLCIGIVLGLTLGEVLSFLFLYICYIFSKDRYKYWTKTDKKTIEFKRITNVIIPIAASSYITGILHSAESMLIPYCFSLFGGDKAQSLAEFGLIRGMVIPTLFFPFAFLSSVISILIPEISRLNTFTDKTRRDEKIQKILRITYIFSIAAGGIFFFMPEHISLIFYNNNDSVYAFKLLALVTPFMYIETISDGILKGIGHQIFTMKTSIINSVSRILIIVLLIPKTGTNGYLWLLIISNMFAYFMCAYKLNRATTVRIGLKTSVLPFVYTALSGLAVQNLLNKLVLKSTLLEGIIGIIVYIGIYGLLYLFTYKYDYKHNKISSEKYSFFN
ncbi:oligosaccharide flippase family protein [Eubacteriales bacterium OttesenSCG-928-G02]|nr:oligosaccharide flippase family protein [Eubacteriales bacterium OttesenSCG-928-G02]